MLDVPESADALHGLGQGGDGRRRPFPLLRGGGGGPGHGPGRGRGVGPGLRRYGVPDEILTDNGKVFTGRRGPFPGEVLFERVCRENGIRQRLTGVRSPTTTGKAERFHKTLREDFLDGAVFADLEAAQAALDAWVEEYNSLRPHQSLGMVTPAERFRPSPTTRCIPRRSPSTSASATASAESVE